jgi:hypothetical protein
MARVKPQHPRDFAFDRPDCRKSPAITFLSADSGQISMPQDTQTINPTPGRASSPHTLTPTPITLTRPTHTKPPARRTATNPPAGHSETRNGFVDMNVRSPPPGTRRLIGLGRSRSLRSLVRELRLLGGGRGRRRRRRRCGGSNYRCSCMLGRSPFIYTHKRTKGIDGGRETWCSWKGCEAVLNSWALLEKHVLHAHLYPGEKEKEEGKVWRCEWDGCGVECRGREEVYRHCLVRHMGEFSARCPFGESHSGYHHNHRTSVWLSLLRRV